MIRVNIQTEISPVVGTEQQSEEMIRYFMDGFEQDPQKLWQATCSASLFPTWSGKDRRTNQRTCRRGYPSEVQQTLEKIINEGTGGMVCILL